MQLEFNIMKPKIRIKEILVHQRDKNNEPKKIVTYPKCRQSVERMKASLIGFIACNGLNGPSESHLIIPSKQINQSAIHPYNSYKRPQSMLLGLRYAIDLVWCIVIKQKLQLSKVKLSSEPK